MKLERSKEILSLLAHGINPQTNCQLPSDSLYNDPDIIRSFWIILAALDHLEPLTKPQKSLYARTVEPWSDQEDRFLMRGFKNGKSIRELSNCHLRTECAIRSRLHKFDLIENSEKIDAIHSHSEEALLQTERSYFEQTDFYDVDNLYEPFIEQETAEEDTTNSHFESYIEEQEHDPNYEDWSEIEDDLDRCNSCDGTGREFSHDGTWTGRPCNLCGGSGILILWRQK